MQLRARIVGFIVLVFVVVLGVSYLLFGWLQSDIMAGLGSVYAEKQVLYNQERTLHPLMRELALAQKLADSSVIHEWARAEDDPVLRAAGLRELEDYRRFFSDGSYFFVVDSSGHYYFNDSAQTYTGSELRYTLDPTKEENRWYYVTVDSGEPYTLNVDFDEELGVTKVWMNVVVREGDETLGIIGTGIDLSRFLSEVVTSDRAGVTNIFVEEGGAIQAHNEVELIDFRSISKDPSEKKIVFHLLDDEKDRRALADAMDRLRADPAGGVDVLVARIGGEPYLIGLGYLEEIGWFNLTLIDAGTMIGSDRFLPLAGLLVAALLLTCGLLIVMLNRLFIARVGRLDSWVRGFAHGGLTGPPGSEARDEIGRLEKGFQQMAESVRRNTELLEATVEERTHELVERNASLQQALADINALSGLLPTCMYCKKIRDEATGEWASMEEFITQRSEAEFSHGICPECEERMGEGGAS